MSDNVAFHNFPKASLIALRGSNRQISEDLQCQIMSYRPRSFMKLLVEEFSKNPLDSPIMKTLWTTIMVISVFHKEDWRFLKHLLVKEKGNDSFMKIFMDFQVWESQDHRGAMWVGGMTVNPTSFSHEMFDREIREEPKWRKKIRNYFSELIHGWLWIIHF